MVIVIVRYKAGGKFKEDGKMQNNVLLFCCVQNMEHACSHGKSVIYSHLSANIHLAVQRLKQGSMVVLPVYR